MLAPTFKMSHCRLCCKVFIATAVIRSRGWLWPEPNALLNVKRKGSGKAYTCLSYIRHFDGHGHNSHSTPDKLRG